MDAKADIEPMSGTKLYQVAVLAKKLKKLGHSERQDLVWRIANRTLNSDQQLRISLIYTFSPEDVDED